MNNDNLFLVKYAKMDGTTGFGLEDANAVRTLMNGSQAASLDSMLSAESNAPRATDIISALRQMATAPLDRASVTFQSPVDQQEIWAAGVTYKRSEEAREEESNNSNIYSRILQSNELRCGRLQSARGNSLRCKVDRARAGAGRYAKRPSGSDWLYYR